MSCEDTLGASGPNTSFVNPLSGTFSSVFRGKGFKALLGIQILGSFLPDPPPPLRTKSASHQLGMSFRI